MKSSANIQIGEDDVDIQLTSKKFSTGSVGFYGQGKGMFNDKRYQISVIVVEIGSKNKPKLSRREKE